MRDDPTEITAATLKRKNCDPRVEDRSNNNIDQLFDLLPTRAFDRTFPDCADAPAQRDKSLLIPVIAYDRAADFRLPELGACFWPVKHRAIMAVPEATIDEEHSVMARKNQIWFAGQLLVMQPKAESPRMQPAPNYHFRLRVTALDGSHVPAAGLAVVDVSQPGEPPADCPALLPLQYAAS